MSALITGWESYDTCRHGSLANLIVAEPAALAGVRLSFRDHARVGVLEEYFGEVRPQRFGIGRLTAEADITVWTDHIQTCTPGAIVVVQLAPGIQKYFAFAYTVLGELVGDDQVRFDAVWVRVNGCVGQALQLPVRFHCRERTREQHQVVHGST